MSPPRVRLACRVVEVNPVAQRSGTRDNGFQSVFKSAVVLNWFLKRREWMVYSQPQITQQSNIYVFHMVWHIRDVKNSTFWLKCHFDLTLFWRAYKGFVLDKTSRQVTEVTSKVVAMYSGSCSAMTQCDFTRLSCELS